MTFQLDKRIWGFRYTLTTKVTHQTQTKKAKWSYLKANSGSQRSGNVTSTGVEFNFNALKNKDDKRNKVETALLAVSEVSYEDSGLVGLQPKLKSMQPT